MSRKNVLKYDIKDTCLHQIYCGLKLCMYLESKRITKDVNLTATLFSSFIRCSQSLLVGYPLGYPEEVNSKFVLLFSTTSQDPVSDITILSVQDPREQN